MCLLQAMQVQNHVWAPANMTVITALLSIPINIVLVRYYGFWGAALATSVARTLLLILLCGELHCTALSNAHHALYDEHHTHQRPPTTAICAVRHGSTAMHTLSGRNSQAQST